MITQKKTEILFCPFLQNKGITKTEKGNVKNTSAEHGEQMSTDTLTLTLMLTSCKRTLLAALLSGIQKSFVTVLHNMLHLFI